MTTSQPSPQGEAQIEKSDWDKWLHYTLTISSSEPAGVNPEDVVQYFKRQLEICQKRFIQRRNYLHASAVKQVIEHLKSLGVPL